MHHELKKNIRNKLIIFPLLFVLGFALFYKFMTYDRSYYWSKEFEYKIREITESTGLSVDTIKQISIDEINRPTEKKIKIKIQKFLSWFGFMNYGQEYGVSISHTFDKSDGKLICKGWCLDDYLIGLEIEYENMNENTLISLKHSFEKKFSNYKIIWTEGKRNKL